ncbi:squalene/phytoene synthase family protein [Caenimonas soli]|uniref:squalene/phytoene synthase family protein n=1 Tax=Caenimonas soli TaxID=2735555 RepID=UPI001F25B050|nr:squalene/phytoene synthase family protein [Caenimonas soli]
MSPADRSNPHMLVLLRGVSRSFYVSIRLLPAPLRRPIGVAYLLARAADTLADTAELRPSERRAHLETWAAAVDGRIPALAVARLSASFAPLQQDPQERALVRALPHCLRWLDELAPADREDVRAVLRHITRGQALDIERFGQDLPPRALDSAEQLHEYTYLVAGCVGEFWTDLCFRHLPGFATLPQQEMRELGRGFGMGLQLVNILRDAGADLAAGRCYFPADELAAAGVAPEDILNHPERFEVVWRRWHAHAQDRIALGMRYADAVNSRRVRAASALPALLAARTLALMRSAGPQRLRHKVKVPRHEVRTMMARLAFTLAGRAALQSSFARLRWDNPHP